MKTASIEASPPVHEFRHMRQSLQYGDIYFIRRELEDFLKVNGIAGEARGNLLLMLTEILSNIVKHPVTRASHVEIRSGIQEEEIILEILDDSASFEGFEEKCAAALSSQAASAASGAENGYGLGMILRLSRSVAYSPAGARDPRLNIFRISHPLRKTGALKLMPDKTGKQTVFLVDDDPVSLQIHEQMLISDYDVITFETAEDALASFTHKKPALIISDMSMPGMDGAGLRKALDHVEGGNTTPFIFLSGFSDGEHNPYISQLGVDDFLCKPVSRERLHTVLTRLLHRSRQINDSVLGQFHHDITKLLKPELPQSYGAWTFTTRNMVAEAGGGDFILHQQAQTNLMVVLADVMGHGRQAKFFSYVYAGYLRSMFRLYAGSLDAAHFLKYLSQSIEGDPLLESMILTCQCFQFFPEGILKASSAGHPFPILLRRSGAELIETTGPLPGLSGDSLYDMKSVRLEKGDKVLFMTDGFLEEFNGRGRGTEEILRQINAAPQESAAGFAERLWGEFQVRQKNRTKNKDDATIIIAEYGGQS